MKGIKGLLFDYGGTLDTNARHWAKVIWDGYKEASVGVTEAQFRSAYVYAERFLATNKVINKTDNFYVLLVKKVSLELDFLVDNGFIRLSMAEKSNLVRQISDYCYKCAKAIVENSRNVLLKLSEKYSMALVTNFYGNINAVLNDFDLHLFASVIESAVVEVRKPDAAIWKLGVEALGLAPSNVAIVGDSFDKDILPARSIGCKTIWFKGEGWTDKTEDETIPSAVITKLDQLLQIL